jgi:peptidoglycan/LPS O-acetylase OafA/YrhL
MDSTNLDFLRANAVLMVLVFHIFDFFGIKRFGPFELQAMGGFGVLLFFVHTSLVLMLSLDRQIARFGRRRLFLMFMLRRCFRIYPLSLCVVTTIVLLKLPLSGTPWNLDWTSMRRMDIISNLLLTQNLTVSPSIPGPLWSLPFEMQMYLVLPALFLVAKKLKSPWAALPGWLLITGIVFLCLQWGHGYRVMYVPCFLAGVIAYRFSQTIQRRWVSWGWPMVLASVMTLRMFVGKLEAAWWLCLTIGMLVPRFREMRSPLLRRTSQLIAKYSYGIYLTHVVCIWAAFVGLRRLPAASQWIIFAAILVSIPVLLYHGVEAPLINIGKRIVEGWLAPAEVEVPMAELQMPVLTAHNSA